MELFATLRAVRRATQVAAAHQTPTPVDQPRLERVHADDNDNEPEYYLV